MKYVFLLAALLISLFLNAQLMGKPTKCDCKPQLQPLPVTIAGTVISERYSFGGSYAQFDSVKSGWIVVGIDINSLQLKYDSIVVAGDWAIYMAYEYAHGRRTLKEYCDAINKWALLTSGFWGFRRFPVEEVKFQEYKIDTTWHMTPITGMPSTITGKP